MEAAARGYRPGRVQSIRVRLVAVIVVAAVAGVGACTAGDNAMPSPSSGASAEPSVWALDTSGPIPDGMLPLGPTESQNQPPGPCTPGIPGISSPTLFDALPADQLQGDPQPAGVGQIVNYDWGGHRPVAADSLRVAVPQLNWTLRPRAARMRMVVATSTGICFAGWRVTARPLDGYDGAQDDGHWALLGEGSAQTDATVVEGLPAGDWIVHVHLAYAPANTAPTHTSESYVRVVVGDRLAVPAPNVAEPDPPVDCSGQSLAPGRTPEVVLAVDGVEGTTSGLYDRGNTGEPASMPGPTVQLRAGARFTIRTADGTCGNDWSGLFFFAVPDDLTGPIASLSGLTTNNGTDPDAVTPQLTGAMAGLAPAPGEWLIGAIFWFGGPDAALYYWRVSVS
jgi:hypothetical protein